MGQSRPLFVYFRYFFDTISIIQIEKSVVGVLGIQTQGRRMVGADETTELWRPPNAIYPYDDCSILRTNFKFVHSRTFLFSFSSFQFSWRWNFFKGLVLNHGPLFFEAAPLYQLSHNRCPRTNLWHRIWCLRRSVCEPFSQQVLKKNITWRRTKNKLDHGAL